MKQTHDRATRKVDGDYYRHECNRCGHVWYGTCGSPTRCASHACASPLWDRVRTRSRN